MTQASKQRRIVDVSLGHGIHMGLGFRVGFVSYVPACRVGLRCKGGLG